MEYSLYKLKFTTGIHIGIDRGGQSLDNTLMTIHSDTLFSALCCEYVKTGDINSLYESFEKDRLVISDALPYYEDRLFLPKPIIFNRTSRQQSDSSLKKKFKSIEFIPLDAFDKYINGLQGEEVDPGILEYEFGRSQVDTKVAINGQTHPMPYNVTSWRFNDKSGLYIVVGYQDNNALALFQEALTLLSLSGIGGKQSSGLGKFSFEKMNSPSLLKKMLEKTDAQYQMLLGTALPRDNELNEKLDGGWYSVIRRGGFIRSETYSPNPIKKRTVYMLSPGSCLRNRFKGEIINVANGGPHPVWRCCKTLFVGVNL